MFTMTGWLNNLLFLSILQSVSAILEASQSHVQSHLIQCWYRCGSSSGEQAPSVNPDFDA